MRRKIVIIIKSLCGAILCGQPKVKKVSILHYSIDIDYHSIIISLAILTC